MTEYQETTKLITSKNLSDIWYKLDIPFTHFYFLLFCLCKNFMWMRVCIPLSSCGAYRGQMTESYPQELELLMVVS